MTIGTLSHNSRHNSKNLAQVTMSKQVLANDMSVLACGRLNIVVRTISLFSP